MLASRRAPRTTLISRKLAVLSCAPAQAQKPNSAAAGQNPGLTPSSSLPPLLLAGVVVNTSCARPAITAKRSAVMTAGESGAPSAA
eukprot:5030329-Prymnesium_polylepis.2